MMFLPTALVQIPFYGKSEDAISLLGLGIRKE